MPYLLRVNAYPSERNMHGTLGMLLTVDKGWIMEQLRRRQKYLKHKAKESALSHHKYWGGYFPVVDLSGIGMDILADQLEDCELIAITEEDASAIDNSEQVRLDVNQIEISDEVHMTARGKSNDLEYESENLTDSDLNRILASLRK